MNQVHRKTEKGKGTNHVPKPPLVAKNILEQKKDQKLERIISLEKLSFVITTHLKIKMPYW
jgi:hypothetical protein